MSAQEKRDATTTNIIYSLVPAQPLPVVDLSKSFRGQLLPDNVHTYIRKRYYKYNRYVLLCAAVSYGINFIVPMVKAPAGHVLSFLAVLLWLSMGLGSITTLRYDIVRLVCRTFDFWFFSMVTSMIVVTMSMYFGDLRSVRTMIDWFGYHHVICVDAHVLGLRNLTFFLIAAIFSSLVALTWMMCGQVDQSSTFMLVEHENMYGSFELSGLDLIASGLVSLGLLLTKIVFRRRQVLQCRCKRSAIVECVIYRCRLKLEPAGLVVRSGENSRQLFQEASSRRAEIVQHLMFVKFPLKLDAHDTVLPWRISKRFILSPWATFGLYSIGMTGLILSHALLFHELSEGTETESNEEHELLLSVTAVLCTIAFITPFVAFYQRQLLKLLVYSFDFAFYSIQITAVDVCVCALYGWDLPQCLLDFAQDRSKWLCRQPKERTASH